MDTTSPYVPPAEQEAASPTPFPWLKPAAFSLLFAPSMHVSDAMIEMVGSTRPLSSALIMPIILVPSACCLAFYFVFGGALFCRLWSQRAWQHIFAGGVAAILFLVLWAVAGYTGLAFRINIFIRQPYGRYVAITCAAVAAVTGVLVTWSSLHKRRQHQQT